MVVVMVTSYRPGFLSWPLELSATQKRPPHVRQSRSLSIDSRPRLNVPVPAIKPTTPITLRSQQYTASVWRPNRFRFSSRVALLYAGATGSPASTSPARTARRLGKSAES